MKTRLPKPLICMILPLLAVLLVLTTADTVSAQESPVDWTSFVASTGLATADGTATGTLTTGSETANVSYAGDVRQGPGVTTFIGSSGASDRICVDGDAGDVHTITFSQPVLNPRYNIFSLGTPSLVIEWDFATPFLFLNGNGFLSNPSGNILRGNGRKR